MENTRILINCKISRLIVRNPVCRKRFLRVAIRISIWVERSPCKYGGTGKHSLGNHDSLACICPRMESMPRIHFFDLGRTVIETVVWDTLKSDRKTFEMEWK